MYFQIFILVAGLALLYFGSSLLVEGSASTAIMFSVRPVIVGLTIVSLATSAPELMVSLVAAYKDSGGISIGNILGSNVINIALVLGISAVIRPVVIKKQIVKIEIPYMVLISVVFWLLCLDNNVGRVDGIVLITLLIAFLIYGIMNAKDKDNGRKVPQRSTSDILKNVLFIIGGIIMLAYGARFVVQEAIIIAKNIGLSET
ncbi:MAG: sodium:calcium antiporter, partial [Desulfobacteraceae bacterium]|nr:sodium:calcium antiporter [Desulfobacteraceae bacterium]